VPALSPRRSLYGVQQSFLYPKLLALVCPNCRAHRDLPEQDAREAQETELQCPLCGERARVPRWEPGA